MQLRQTLQLAEQGFYLLDQKRKALIQESISAYKYAEELRLELDKAYTEAKKAFIFASLSMGRERIEAIIEQIPIERGVELGNRRIMGIEVPLARLHSTGRSIPPYKLGETTSALDKAYRKMSIVKQVIVEQIAAENTARLLQFHISKTQKRANALEHIIIPQTKAKIRFIQDTLEERERDSFARMKLHS